jgi:hypothetical protein
MCQLCRRRFNALATQEPSHEEPEGLFDLPDPGPDKGKPLL